MSRLDGKKDRCEAFVRTVKPSGFQACMASATIGFDSSAISSLGPKSRDARIGVSDVLADDVRSLNEDSEPGSRVLCGLSNNLTEPPSAHITE